MFDDNLLVHGTQLQNGNVYKRKYNCSKCRNSMMSFLIIYLKINREAVKIITLHVSIVFHH
jgi:hypothetical protein